MSTLEEFNEAIEAGLYNKFTRLKLYFVLHLQDSSQDFSYELIYMQYV